MQYNTILYMKSDLKLTKYIPTGLLSVQYPRLYIGQSAVGGGIK